jgi:hypothetical protein
MNLCESLVNTRALSVRKLEQEIIGFLNQDKELLQKPFSLEVYVTNVHIKLSVQNGQSSMSITESGAVLRKENANR